MYKINSMKCKACNGMVNYLKQCRRCGKTEFCFKCIGIGCKICFRTICKNCICIHADCGFG